MKVSSKAIIITCEHGGNRVPAAYTRLFRNKKTLLDSHHGHDRGALTIARRLSRKLASPLEYSTTTRLLVDLNRSLHHPKLFSEITRPCEPGLREKIISLYYTPYRNRVESLVLNHVRDNRLVLHFSIHSFTPVLNGETRNADLGILYDPSRSPEKIYAKELQRFIRTNYDYRVRMNYPYPGKADGFTTSLRKTFKAECYVGIEIEINQKFFKRNLSDVGKISSLLSNGINSLIKVG